MQRLLLTALAAVVLALPSTVATAQPAPVVVHVAATPDDQSSPILYAVHAGLFERVGLKVELTRMSSGAAVAAAVAGGSLQFGGSATMPLVAAHARGIPFQLVAPGFAYNSARPNELLLVKKDGPIHSARDLDGKRIGSSSLKDLLSTATRAWIDANGGDSKTVQGVEVPTSAVLPALEAGRIDAATIPEPRLGQALKSGQVRVLGKSFDAIAKRFLVTSFFTSASYAQQNPDVVRKFAQVMAEANRYANAHPAETAPLLSAFSGVPVAVIDGAVRETYAERFTAAELQPVIDVAVKYGVISKPFPAEDLISPLVR